jgi:hypothetical protein
VGIGQDDAARRAQTAKQTSFMPASDQFNNYVAGGGETTTRPWLQRAYWRRKVSVG